MKSFNQLKDIAEIYTLQVKELPNNPFLLCSRLQIKYKYKAECIKDFGKHNPLISVPAVLYKDSSDVVIYVDESSKYWRFYMFHELSHYILEHDIDDIQSEQEANMLACLLLAPALKLPTYLKTAQDLSCQYQIPIGRAEEYWNELKQLKIKTNKKLKYSLILFCIVLSVFLLFGVFVQNPFTHQSNNIKAISNTPIVHSQPSPSAQPIENITDIYYITKTGTKYHTSDCQYIKNKDNIKSIKLQDAIKHGYEPCSVCIKK